MRVLPLIADLARWNLLFSGFVLGGAGFNDVLFVYGFYALVILSVYHGLIWLVKLIPQRTRQS
jgi:hypothetical protein